MKLMRLFAIGVLIFTAQASDAQTTSAPIDSWMNVIDSTTVRVMTATPLDATSGPLISLVQNLPPSTTQTVVTFPAATSPYTLVGFRLAITVTGTGFKVTGPVQVDAALPSLSVPVGAQVQATYLAPLSGLGTLTATLILPPPPPPVVVPPAPTASPDGTRIDATTPTATVRDSAGAVWGILPVDLTADHTSTQTAISRNGVRVSRAVDYLIWRGGKICQQDITSSSTPNNKTCECWSGTAWASALLSSC